MRKRFTLALPHWGFWVSMLITAAMGAALFSAAHDARESSELLNDSYAVLRTLGAIDEQLTRAESTNRGYLLSGNDAFLVERDEALLTLREMAQRLRTLIAGNTFHATRIAALDALIASRTSIMRTVERQWQPDSVLRPDPPLIRRAREVSGRMFELTSEMEREEERLLAARRAGVETAYETAIRALLVTALIVVLVLVPGYVGFSVQSRARQRAEDKLHAVAEGMPGAIYKRRSYPHGASHFEFVSPGVKQLRGIDHETAIRDACALWHTVLPEDRETLGAAMAEAEHTLQPMDVEFRVTLPGGEVRWLRDWAALRRERDGSTVWNGQWTDITAHRELERALHVAKEAADDANRAKSTFLAVMSHEIRTPMNSLLGMLELLSLTQLDDSQRRTVSIVRESGKSLQRIIDDILDFSKIEAGRLEIVPAAVSPRQAVEEVRLLYSSAASRKGLTLKCTVNPNVGAAVRVDPLRLRQIIGNLVSNAIKFTPAGEVEIALESLERGTHAETIRFSVRDTGIGISPADQKRLFEPFTQVGAGQAQHAGGTGLGLAICRRLAHLMGGSIDAASTPGQGTTVSLTLALPLADAAAIERLPTSLDGSAPHVAFDAPLAPPSAAEAERDGTLVLVVDDHPTNRTLLCRQVNTLGYAVDSAAGGREALEKWQARSYGLVLTDCNMDDIDGYELVRTIREIEEDRALARRTPIVACTANALPGSADACFAAGMDDFLAKPIELTAMAAKLRQWLPALHDREPRLQQASSGAVDEAGDALIDTAVLAAICGASPERERDILLEFGRTTAEDAVLLRAALEAHDLTAVRRSAHRIAGAAQFVGANPVAAAAAVVEHASAAGDEAAARALLADLDTELLRLAAELEARCNRGARGAALTNPNKEAT
jgi:signal transduction histidine kinase/DNA-binding response OmpR family regulator/CHASE3 domain sensor protein